MDQSQLDELVQKGFDVEGALKRFINNVGLYEKCLKKFLDDESFDALEKAFADGNCQDAFKAAHTLKGLTSNLGMNNLYGILQPMVEKLRVDNLDIASEMEQLRVEYKLTYELVDKI